MLWAIYLHKNILSNNEIFLKTILEFFRNENIDCYLEQVSYSLMPSNLWCIVQRLGTTQGRHLLVKLPKSVLFCEKCLCKCLLTLKQLGDDQQTKTEIENSEL